MILYQYAVPMLTVSVCFADLSIMVRQVNAVLYCAVGSHTSTNGHLHDQSVHTTGTVHLTAPFGSTTSSHLLVRLLLLKQEYFVCCHRL